MTRCGYVEVRLRALIDGELEPVEHQQVLRHLEACAGCRDGYRRTQAVAAALQEHPLESPPAHFSAGLQVRLSRHRRARRRALTPPWRWAAPWRWAGGMGVVLGLAAAGTLVLSAGLNAGEVARRADRSWQQIHSYGCVFVSRGSYQGQERSFTQRQFFRRPGEFRLETAQDYPLTTYVYPDRVVHYLPGGEWQGRGPLVILRPRREAESALPFPFGVTWQPGGNISLDQVVRQLSASHDPFLVGTERVGERDCYRLRLTAPPRRRPGGPLRALDRPGKLPAAARALVSGPGQPDRYGSAGPAGELRRAPRRHIPVPDSGRRLSHPRGD